ncbi:hypothetical protein J3R74_000034 [Puniceicoccus vermicola]
MATPQDGEAARDTAKVPQAASLCANARFSSHFLKDTSAPENRILLSRFQGRARIDGEAVREAQLKLRPYFKEGFLSALDFQNSKGT